LVCGGAGVFSTDILSPSNISWRNIVSDKIADQTGLVGYLPKENLDAFSESAGKDGVAEVRFEPGKSEILMRVKTQDILRIIPAGEHEGDIKVHVLLKPSTHVETVIKAFRNVSGIEDPTLSRLSAASSVSVSFV